MNGIFVSSGVFMSMKMEPVKMVIASFGGDRTVAFSQQGDKQEYHP
jgi:hypothetical protein